MANNGAMWAGQCGEASNVAENLNGQTYAGGTLSSCSYTLSQNFADCMQTLTYYDPATTYTSTNVAPVAVSLSLCDSSVLRPGDLGLTVELVGLVILFGIGWMIGGNS